MADCPLGAKGVENFLGCSLREIFGRLNATNVSVTAPRAENALVMLTIVRPRNSLAILGVLHTIARQRDSIGAREGIICTVWPGASDF